MKSFKKKIFNGFLIVSLTIILFNALTQLYKNRTQIFHKMAEHGIEHDKNRFLVNPLNKSNKQVPPKNLKDLITNGDEDKVGAWSAPFDWNVVAIHAILLPDETVMTFGTYGVKEKESGKDIRENKVITLTDTFKLTRDGGDHQWAHHNVQAGVDFDIWDPKKGVGDDSHILIKKPIVVDAFCSVLRVFDLENVFILGGNVTPKEGGIDTQNATTFYNVKTKKFKKGNNLNYNRWYGSIIRNAEDEFIMVGGVKVRRFDDHILEYSPIPEILEKDESGTYNWRLLFKAKSKDLFGSEDGEEYFYPKSYLASDGNIFGISYNKLWAIDPSEDYQITKVGEIPLVEGGIKQIFEHINPNNYKNNKRLKLMTIGAGVSRYASSVMIDKDKILLVGGLQWGNEYSPSNHVNLIDISNSKKPTVTKMKSMNYPRSNGDAIMLPTGEVFVNGGSSYINDREFSVFNAEIYNPSTNSWKILDGGTFRRNYHSISLLLPNGTILVAGGDVWNAEIFYPPYLFTKDWDNKVVFAERPKIEKINKTITNRSEVKVILDNTSDISKISILSTGSTTHAQGSEPKFLNIDFEKVNEKEIVLNITEDKNILQNGTYLIFAINSSNVPSEGKIVYLN